MYVTFDIETTGLTANSKVTTAGFGYDDQHEIHYLSSNRSEVAHPDSAALEDTFNEQDIVLVEHKSETALFEGLRQTIDELSEENPQLTIIGFNSSNFDIPHLRTRSVLQNLEFPFAGHESLDLTNLFQYKFRTETIESSGLNKRPLRKFAKELGADVNSNMSKSKIDDVVKETGFTRDELLQFADEHGYDIPTKSTQTLEGLHDLFVDDSDSIQSFDPFDNSEAAAEAFQNGHLDLVVKHNLVDLRMTDDLLSIVQQTVPRSEIRTRDL